MDTRDMNTDKVAALESMIDLLISARMTAVLNDVDVEDALTAVIDKARNAKALAERERGDW